MFIYQGKLKWYGFSDNELFTFIFPKGLIRENDPVYVCTQWTKDKHNRKERNLQTIVVKDVHNQPGTTDVSFTLPGAWYQYVVTTEQNYSKIKIHMTSKSNGDANLALERVWQAQGQVDPDAALRVWGGKMTWRSSIVKEQAILIVPEGFGNGKPVISFWQWTKDDHGNAKTSALKGSSMKAVESDDKTTKFTFSNYFENITCTWNKVSGKLALNIKDKTSRLEIAALDLEAKIEPQVHSFDSDDLTPPTKKEVELRLPNPQTALTRIHEPMPFPKTLLETLSHGAAFIEQAGYLTVQAQNKFTALHADFHKQTDLVEALQKDKQNLEEQIKSLSVERNNAKSRIDQLEKDLATASETYQKKVKELEQAIANFKSHDKADASTINKLAEDVTSLMHENMHLRSELNAAKRDLNRHDAIICDLQSKNTDLESKRKAAENELKVQKESNEKLRNTNGLLQQKLQDALSANESLQVQLADHEKIKTDRDEAVKKLATKENELKEKQTELEAAQSKATLFQKEYTKAEGARETAHKAYETEHSQKEGYLHKTEEYSKAVLEWIMHVSENKNKIAEDKTKEIYGKLQTIRDTEIVFK